jgi:Bacteriocin-protection, YdeI or OmpD-Associated
VGECPPWWPPDLVAACSKTSSRIPQAHPGSWSVANLGRVSGNRVSGGVVHKLPADLREALIANATALTAWQDITPLARNEFICWVEDAKQEATRQRRIRRTQEELEEGQRRPCCWPGCKHRERTGRP